MVVVISVGLVAAVFAARTWGDSSPDAAAAPSPAVDQSKPGLVTYPPAQRVKVPNLTGTTLGGERVSLRDFAGKIVVVNVWGSWCGPCRAETPDLVRLARQDAARGVAFLGVDTRDNLGSGQAFARKFNVLYPSIFDESGASLLPLRGTIPTSVIPSSVVIDAKGNVAARVIGPVTYTTLSGVLNDVIAAGSR
ncbi:TlpA family protein disulfide reductase [Nocardioides korecus]